MLQDPDSAASAQIYLYGSLAAYLGHGGIFDYQREGNSITGYTHFPQFRNVSNFKVGLFCQRAGLSLDETLRISGVFAGIFSSNAKPDQPYGLDTQTAQYIRIGYEAGASGGFSRKPGD